MKLSTADTAEVAWSTIQMVDHTRLEENDKPENVEEFVRKCCEHRPLPAAFCIYPQYLEHIKRCQAQDPVAFPHVKLCSVLNFPLGIDPLEKQLADVKKAVAAGVEEMDVVIDYNLYKSSKHAAMEKTEQYVKAVRTALPAHIPLKVILESGELQAPHLISAASIAALKGGADFLKTSTGKVKVNATPEAARTMMTCIAAFQHIRPNRKIGFKAAGGVRDLDQAKAYIRIAEEVMGESWATPETFRFGTSSLIWVLIKTFKESIKDKLTPLVELVLPADKHTEAGIREIFEHINTSRTYPAALLVPPELVKFAHSCRNADAKRLSAIQICSYIPSDVTEGMKLVERAALVTNDGADVIEISAPQTVGSESKEKACDSVEALVKYVCEALPKTTFVRFVLENNVGVERQCGLAVAAMKGGANFVSLGSSRKPGTPFPRDVLRSVITAIDVFGMMSGMARPIGVQLVANDCVNDCMESVILYESIMGPGRASPQTLRFSSSNLLVTLRDHKVAQVTAGTSSSY